MEAEIWRKENSMSYDNDVLNQRSDPTLNQISSQFSLAKLFVPNASDEEEKYMNFENRGAKSPVIAHNYIEPERKIERKSEESKNKKSTIQKLDDLLDFDDANEEVDFDATNPDQLLDELLKSHPNVSKLKTGSNPENDQDKLVFGLLKVIKGLTNKISDFENTSRANRAMLDNRISKIQGGNHDANKNLNKLMSLMKTQDEEILNTTDYESDLSEESIEDIQMDTSKNSMKSPLKESPKVKVSTNDLSIQTEMKPAAFPFGCQTNFANASDTKIKELKELLANKEEVLKAKTLEFEAKLKEANKMDDVEDAFQAFLDQLDLNENEERIIIDGESRVWKIIRCSKSIIEDECLEEEEEEDEEEQNAKEKQIKQDAAEEIKKQLRNRDRPTNPMRKLESPVVEPAEIEKDKKDTKEGILIVEDVVDEDDSHDVSEIKEDLEGSIGDAKSGRNSKDLQEAINEVEAIEKSDGESENEQEQRFPVLSDEEKDQGFEEIKDCILSPKLESAKLKVEDLSDKQSSSNKKEHQIEEKPKENSDTKEGVQPFEFSEDSKESIKDELNESIKSNNDVARQNLQELYNQFQADISGMSRSKSEDWGGGLKDYQNSEDAIQPMKLHYTEGDLSNIELVEEESEGEEGEEREEEYGDGESELSTNYESRIRGGGMINGYY